MTQAEAAGRGPVRAGLAAAWRTWRNVYEAILAAYDGRAMRAAFRRLLRLSAVGLTACGGGNHGLPTTPAPGGTLTLGLQTAHFRLYTDAASDDGDTTAVLGLSPPAFEEAWYAFVRERCLR